MNSTDSSFPLRGDNSRSEIILIFASQSTSKDPDPRSRITQVVLFTVNELLLNSPSPNQPKHKRALCHFFSLCVGKFIAAPGKRFCKGKFTLYGAVQILVNVTANLLLFIYFNAVIF